MKLIGKLALKSSKAIDFWNASKEFKNHLIEELTYRALKKSVERSRNLKNNNTDI